MKNVYFIRHGQSTGNIDIPAEDHTLIPLTELGNRQAEAVPDKLTFIPDIIITSPYTRARQTAEPTIKKYSSVPVEIWPEIQEFTSLSPVRCYKTNREQRRPWVQEYWKNMDPYYNDGDGAESFAYLIERAEKALEKLMKLPYENIVLFSHGQFMVAFDIMFHHKDMPIKEKMELVHKTPAVRNTDIVKYMI